MRRRGDISVADVGGGLVTTAVVVAAWFGCAAALGVFVGVVWRVAKWLQS